MFNAILALALLGLMVTPSLVSGRTNRQLARRTRK
jgi:hypothetical protein